MIACKGEKCWSGLPKDLVSKYWQKSVSLLTRVYQECALMTGLIIMGQTSSLMCGACTTIIRSLFIFISIVCVCLRDYLCMEYGCMYYCFAPLNNFFKASGWHSARIQFYRKCLNVFNFFRRLRSDVTHSIYLHWGIYNASRNTIMVGPEIVREFN